MSPSPARGQAFVSVSGHVTPADLPELRRKISAALEGGAHDLVVDLRAVSEICVDAVALLEGVASRQVSRGRRLTLVHVPDSPVAESLRRSPSLMARVVACHTVPDWTAVPPS